MAQVQFVGHIGRDTEKRFTATGTAVLSFSVAENDYRNGQEHTNWFDVVVFNGFAESLEKRIEKGSYVFVAGDLRIEEFERKDGTKGRAVRVVANKVQTLGPRREQRGSQQAEDRLAPRPRPAAPAAAVDEEDMPF